MAEIEIHRGEVYEVISDGVFGSEAAFSRPYVIVSSEKGCENAPIVQAIALTSKQKWGVINVPVYINGRQSSAMCNQLYTLDKSRLARKMGVVPPEVMKEIERGLAVVLGLCEFNEPVVSGLEEKVESLENEVMAQKVELAMYQKLYEKAVDQLASMKLDFDIARKATVGVSTNVASKEEPPKVKIYDPGFEPVDVNRCSFDDLKDIGVSTNVALAIIDKRPYMNIEDLRGIPGLTRIAYGILSKKVTVGDVSEFVKTKVKKEEPPVAPPPVEKVNINTATGKELMNKLGINECYAYSITSHRNKNGLYTNLEELKNVKGLAKIFYDKYKDLLEV